MRETGYKKISIPADGYCCYHSMLFITLAMLHGKDYLITSINTHKANIFSLLESYNDATLETNAQKQILQEILNEHIPFPSLYERLSDSLLGNSRTKPVEVILSNIEILENSSQSIEGISSSPLLNTMLSTESKDFNHAQLQSLSHEILQNFLSGKTTAGDLGEHYPNIFHHFIRALASIKLNYASHSDMESNAETAFQTFSKNEGFTALQNNGWGTTADIERFKHGLFGTEGVENDPCHIYGIQFDNSSGIHYDLKLPYAYDSPSDLLVSTVSPDEGLDQRYATALQILENLENTDSRSLPSTFQPSSNRPSPSTSSEDRPLRYAEKSTPMLAQKDTNLQKLAARLTTSQQELDTTIRGAIDAYNNNKKKLSEPTKKALKQELTYVKQSFRTSRDRCTTLLEAIQHLKDTHKKNIKIHKDAAKIEQDFMKIKTQLNNIINGKI